MNLEEELARAAARHPSSYRATPAPDTGLAAPVPAPESPGSITHPAELTSPKSPVKSNVIGLFTRERQ